MKLTKIIIIITIINSIFSINVYAGTTGNLAVTAKVSASCSMTTNTLDFLTPVQQLGISYFSTSSKININCTKMTPYTISLNAGLSGDFNNMYMKGTKIGNTDKLKYNIYQDMYFNTLFTNIANGGQVNAVGNGTTQSIDVWGKVPAAQLVTPDVYIDQVTVTVTY